MTVDLTLRRTYSDHPHPEDNDKFWSVECEAISVGSIVLHQGRADSPPDWHWVVHIHAGRFGNGLPPQDGSEKTREAAMAAFRPAFERCREHIGAEGWQHHIEHMARVRARAEGGRKY